MVMSRIALVGDPCPRSDDGCDITASSTGFVDVHAAR